MFARIQACSRCGFNLLSSSRAIYKALSETDLAGHMDFELHLDRVMGATEDFKEGVMAFFEKREPKFKGR